MTAINRRVVFKRLAHFQIAGRTLLEAACDGVHMRLLIFAFAGFSYVATDIAVNRGAVIHGWVAIIATALRSVGL
jgi:hypothetical protein